MIIFLTFNSEDLPAPLNNHFHVSNYYYYSIPIAFIIALIFLKNQTKPLVRLAKAAERFGKGDYVNDFRASGALEIRKAAYEFDRMAKRINRHLNQRAEMLSGISHDLRTPLTRLKLQLAMRPSHVQDVSLWATRGQQRT